MISEERKRLYRHLDRVAKAIYDDNCVGCCLHIILDDANYDRDSIAFCLNQATKDDHIICKLMCELLAQLTNEELETLWGSDAWGSSISQILMKAEADA